MQCPKCKVAMMVVEFEQIELDSCGQCQGTWFDRGELALLFDDHAEAARALGPEVIEALPEAPTAEKKRRCPICRRKMRKVIVGELPPVLIDACVEGHGLWFDDLEVARLADQLAARLPGAAGKAFAFLGRVFPAKT